MSPIFAAIGVGIILYAFRLKGLPIMTTGLLFVGCFCIVIAAITLDVPAGSPECWIDWDGASNRAICD
jgi:hypothetical protein